MSSQLDLAADPIRNAARRNHSAMLQAPSDLSQKRAAELIGVSEATLSAWKNDHLERAAALIAACGLTMRPITERTLPEEHIAALETLALIGLRRGSRDGQ